MDQRVINIPVDLEARERNRHGMGFRCRGVEWRSADERGLFHIKRETYQGVWNVRQVQNWFHPQVGVGVARYPRKLRVF